MAGKKKWAKGRVREKINNLVVIDQKLADRCMKEIPKLKVVTINTMTEKLKVNGSVARLCIKELVSLGLLKPVTTNNRISVYTRTVEPEVKADVEETKGKKGKKGKKKKAEE